MIPPSLPAFSSLTWPPWVPWPSLAAHFLSCLSEVLTFFICIFFLKQWLQFDLFRQTLWAPEALVFQPHNLNNNRPKTKRFWKRKNRSRSPSRSVGRSEVSEELFTSSHEDVSSLTVDDVSTDLSTDPEDGDLPLDPEPAVRITEMETEDDDSFFSEAVDSTSVLPPVITEEAVAFGQDISEVSSLISEQSWFQEHYEHVLPVWR